MSGLLEKLKAIVAKNTLVLIIAILVIVAIVIFAKQQVLSLYYSAKAQVLNALGQTSAANAATAKAATVAADSGTAATTAAADTTASAVQKFNPTKHYVVRK